MFWIKIILLVFRSNSISNLHHIVEGIGFVGLGSSRLGILLSTLRIWDVAWHTEASVELFRSKFFIEFIKLAEEFTLVELDVI